jgi:hypothetical protein
MSGPEEHVVLMHTDPPRPCHAHPHIRDQRISGSADRLRRGRRPARPLPLVCVDRDVRLHEITAGDGAERDGIVKCVPREYALWRFDTASMYRRTGEARRGGAGRGGARRGEAGRGEGSRRSWGVLGASGRIRISAESHGRRQSPMAKITFRRGRPKAPNAGPGKTRFWPRDRSGPRSGCDRSRGNNGRGNRDNRISIHPTGHSVLPLCAIPHSIIHPALNHPTQPNPTKPNQTRADFARLVGAGDPSITPSPLGPKHRPPQSRVPQKVLAKSPPSKCTGILSPPQKSADNVDRPAGQAPGIYRGPAEGPKASKPQSVKASRPQSFKVPRP